MCSSKVFSVSTISLLLTIVIFCNGKKSLSSTKRPVIGIDLGTTYSCVGIMKEDGSLEILSNEFGSRITPSFVSFNDRGERFIGEDAMRQVVTNPRNTIFDAKRFIGRQWLDPFVQEIKGDYPFEILESDNGKVAFEIRTKTIRRFLTPEEISGMILGKMKMIAEEYLGEAVEDAVITVPAYFNDAQRSSTRDAGAIAGLNVLRILNEPTAAALAYGFGIKDNKGNKPQNIIVYDLGGGTFDVSLLRIHGGSVEVLSTTGDTNLGGRDFDNAVVDYLIRHYIRETGVIEIRDDTKSIEKLRLEVEKAKRVLTSYKTAKIEIDAFHKGLQYSTTLTRDKFNELNIDLFKSTLEKLDHVLEDAKLEIKDINEILLVGGSTRIPMIQQLVRDYFNGKSPKRDINPDEAVVSGAVVQAFMLTNQKGSENMNLMDVIPLSLGIEIKGGLFDKVVNRNTRIPFSANSDYTTTHDNQKSIKFQVFEGERSLTEDNNLLGSFVFDGIEPGPRGTPSIEITIDINANGIVKVTARNTKSYKSQTHTLSNDQRLSSDDIDRMITDAKKFSQKDAQRRADIKAKNALEEFILEIKDIVNAEDSEDLINLTNDQKSILNEAINKVKEWLDLNPNGSEAQYTKTLKDIEKHVDRFFENIGLQYIGNRLREMANTTQSGYEYDRDEL